MPTDHSAWTEYARRHMIVNSLSTGWEIFYHRGHALLAAQIGSHLTRKWRVGNRPARLVETIAALFHHDDVAREWETDHLGPVGTPLDFTMPSDKKSLDSQPLAALVDGALYRGRYVALLVSMHCSFLNEPKRGRSSTMDRFLDEQATFQKQMRGQLHLSAKDAQQAYAFLQWCDRLSLILVQRELPQRERALEISKGPDGRRYDITQRQDGTLCVAPWPFDEARFTVDAEATYLTQAVFKDDAELQTKLKLARVETIEWEFVTDGTPSKHGKRKRAEQKRSMSEAEE